MGNVFDNGLGLTDSDEESKYSDMANAKPFARKIITLCSWAPHVGRG